MTREEMKIQLEKLEETRKNYFYEYQVTKECLEELSPNIKTFLTIGGLDGFGIGNVDSVLEDIEKEMKRHGAEWEKKEIEEIEL